MRKLFLVLSITLITCAVSWSARKSVSKQISPLVRVACVGNSITYGAAVENREVNCYPSVLGRMLGQDYEVRNFGRSGATLLNKGHNPYTKTKEYVDAVTFRPDIVIIHLGINDTDPRNWPAYRDEFIPDYTALIDSFRKANPSVDVYICRMTPIAHRHRRFKAGTREWHRQIQTVIEQVAREQHTGLIDLEAVLINRPDLLPDTVHPNAEGARLIAEQIYSGITGDNGRLEMSELYTDNMVLQRGEATRIGGIANAGRLVTVSLLGLEGSKPRRSKRGVIYAMDTITAGWDGKWSVSLSIPTSRLSAVLTISTEDTTAVYRNVGVGEVWMASGQSNMSWMVSQSAERREAVPNSNIRLFRTNPTSNSQAKLDSVGLARLNGLDYVRNPQGWVSGGDMVTMEAFSAVGWFFAQMLMDSLDAEVPVGLIQTSLGGAIAESFIERQRLEDDPWLDDVLYDWRSNDMAQDWVRKVIGQSLAGTKNPLQRHFFEPCYLHESRTEPLARGYDIKGVIWYQGESNAHNVELHERLFPAVVESFRDAFDAPNMPFYFVQLSSMNRPSWPHFRDSQRRLADSMRCEAVDMVVSSDWGDSTDVHPRHKKPIGDRLALLALGNIYGTNNNVDYSSPRAERALRNGNSVEVVFNRAVMAKDNAATLLTFELAGRDGIYHAATARVENGNVVIVHSSDVAIPVSVRYGWQPFTQANLCGTKGYHLPVSTFKLAVSCF